MSESSSNDPEEENDIVNPSKRPSIKLSRPKENLIMGLDPRANNRRSASAPYLRQDFVPKLKPIKEKLCPSPIILNEKQPPINIINQEMQNTTLSTSSFDSKNEIKKIKIKLRKSSKDINEKVHPTSDYEDLDKKGKNGYESDSSKSGEENDKNNIKVKNKKKNKINAIDKMRIKMTFIKNISLNHPIAIDDSSLGKKFKEKACQIFKSFKISLVNEFRENEHHYLYPLRYRNKSHDTRANSFPSILGFLQRKKSNLSLNSKGK